jgi:transcription elongation factor Elf1
MQTKSTKERAVCPMCGKKPVAINRYLNDIVYYRKTCDSCSRARASGRVLKPQPPAWVRTGYKKKPTCEKCGFKLKLPNQSTIFHIDGNVYNNNWVNLKTVCLNCTQEIKENPQLNWAPSPIAADF